MPRPPRDRDDDSTLARPAKIDPATLDVASKPKRRRARNRKLPEPRPELKQAKPDLRKRADRRPFPPGVILEPAGFDEEHWTAPHSDRDLWELQIADAFGTRSQAVMVAFMHQLERLCGRNIWDDEAQQWRLDEHDFSAMLALVNAVRPRNEMEAALAAQMVAIHWMTMKAAARALRYDGDHHTAAVAGKLARTFTLQLETLARLRRGNRTARQSIKVEKETSHHVHYHVHRGGAESGGEPQAKDGGEIRATGGAAGLPALPSEEEVGRPMPLASREG